MTRKTLFYDRHKSLGGKVIDFHGWLMPVSFETPLKEHEHVRTACGVFDVSHMGELLLIGKDATSFLNYLTINDVERLPIGGGQYSALLYESGGFVDDLIVYRLAEQKYLLCINASNVDKDFSWVKQNVGSFDVTIDNASERYSQLAVQGPLSREPLKAILRGAEAERFLTLKYMEIMAVESLGQGTYLARTGYTGELGFELYVPNEVALKVFDQLLETSATSKLKPIGLGARDTLRLEACYLLYGNDMDENVSPLEAGIAWAVRLDGPDFIGKSALLQQSAAGVPRKLIAFTFEEAGVPRQGMSVLKDGQVIGTVTSGSVFPTLGGSGGLALVETHSAMLGDRIEIDVRGKRKLARVAKRPLYSARVKD